MYADIEALVLSGELFNGTSRSSSPARSSSPSSDKGWHDEELKNYTDDPNTSAQDVPSNHQESIGMGPGRTGVKGVIRDRDEAVEINRQKRNKEMEEVRRRMEKSNLGGKTFLEEEREKGEDEKVDELVRKEREKERTDLFGRTKDGKFGHLREVGIHNFVGAVEKEQRGVWVVVHLYEPSLDRCFLLDDTLSQLARLYPDTKFLRCRASALGFASTPSSSTSATRKSVRAQRPIREDDDDDDPYNEKDYHDDEDEDDEDERDPYEEDNVDLDMLPTVLVYRDGELVHNWVRVDWEAGEAGIEELLDKHHILPSRDVFGAFSLPSDGEDDDDFADDLLLSDDER